MLKSLRKTKLLVLPFYHMVSDDIPFFSKNLYKPRSVKQFKADLAVFLKYYKPISLTQLIKINRGETVLEQPSFHLTFDDGLANFYDVIAPILTENKIPATVFLNSNFVDNYNLFYRYKASVLIEYYKKSTPIIKQVFDNYFEGEEVNKSLLDVDYKNKNKLNDLAKKLDFSFKDYLSINKPYLSLVQIKKLEKKGFTFGAHSFDHPKYKNLTLNEQIQQTEQSLDWVKENLNQTYSTFSFPFSDEGVGNDFFDQMNGKIDLSFGTSGFKKELIPNNIQRLDMEKAVGNAQTYLTKEYLKIPLKKALNKYTINRN